MEKVTFCRICEAHCGMVATVEGDEVVKLRPDKDHPLSRGYACPKGIAMLDVQNDPDRVVHPLKRRADGNGFERVSWDEAIADIGARLRAVIDAHGKKSIGWYAGNPSAFSYSHTIWVAGFMKGLGSPHYYTASSQDVANRFAASALLYGSPVLVPIPDLNRTDFLLIVGANPLVSHGSVLTAPRIREQLLEIEARGGRVVVVDPRRSETARAHEHIAIRPDTDAWFLLSLLQVIFEEGLADERALGEQATGGAWLKAVAAQHPPEETEARTGVPADTCRQLARDLATARSADDLRPYRLVPGPLRDAGRVPARRAERRDRQPRRTGRRGLRPARGRARRRRRGPRGRHVRRRALADRRLPGRDRRDARLPDAAGDRDAGRGPASCACSSRRATR